ncbi:MAG: phosphoadenosine phosphosulfate reductase family protein, partial [Planctomycetaceae bacterium]|nr:phosphoadenosine phosphosulfate reductase family protein [Planctomycetaceae bacterium]
MYSYDWDHETCGYTLSTQTKRFVANELRPVFASELLLYNFQDKFVFDPNEMQPLLWAQKNQFFYDGKKIAQLNKIEYGKPITAEFYFDGKKKLKPVNVKRMCEKNKEILDALVADTLKRIKEVYTQYDKKCRVKYIAFSGGKDSMLLLDLCHRVLPFTVPVVFSDTDMELPDTYDVWEKVQHDKRYQKRQFIKVKAEKSAIENWKLFGPPSRVLRWCCSVHKSTPPILWIRREYLDTDSPAYFLCFVGVRGDESLRRSKYNDIDEGKKISYQTQAQPLINWSAHELWLYTFREKLIINDAYLKGNARVGCLFCPLSSGSGKPLILADTLYPQDTKQYVEEIINSSSREFLSEKYAKEFVFNGGWFARNNGKYLCDVIDIAPIEQQGNQVFFTIPPKKEETFLEWLKIFGRIENHDDKKWILRYHGDIVELQIHKIDKNVQMIFTFQNKKTENKIISHLSKIYHKTLCCISCRSCEAACFHGALQIDKHIRINVEKCIHCLQCNEQNGGCLVYHSKRNAKGRTMNIQGICNHGNFGLQPGFIAKLIEHKDAFREKFGAGKPMTDSAIEWFREAGLMENNTTKITRLLTVAEKIGSDNPFLWQLIWLRLANYSPLVKWFVCFTRFGTTIDRVELDTILSNTILAKSSCDQAIKCLCNFFKNSPISSSLPLVHLIIKGKSVKSITRISIEPEPLTILYGLYLSASLTKRSSFTIREMQSAEFESPYVSPIAAFGIPPETFKTLVNGLAIRYPEFISVSFTHGLDEVRLFP